MCAIGTLKAIVRKPIFKIFIIGMIIRVALMPFFAHNYDVYHWSLAIQHIQAGAGLYEIDGYWYTPVWGYIMGIWGNVMDLFGVTAYAHSTDAALILERSWTPQTANISTMTFNFFIKIPIVIADVLAGYLIYRIILKITEDERKATYGFTLWFLCPFVIYVSAVHGMFDSIAVVFMLLSVYALMKGHYFLAGVSISVAVLTKIFPVFVIFAMVAYLAMKYRGDRKTLLKHTGMAALGAGLMAFVIFLPQILDGTIIETLNFLTGRMGMVTSSSGDAMDNMLSLGMGLAIVFQAVLITVTAFLAFRMYRGTCGHIDERFFACLLISLALVFIIPLNPHYLLILLPFVILFTVMFDKRFFLPFLIISIAALFHITILFYTGHFSLAAAGIMDMDAAVDAALYVSGLLSSGSFMAVIIVLQWTIGPAGCLMAIYYWTRYEKEVRNV